VVAVSLDSCRQQSMKIVWPLLGWGLVLASCVIRSLLFRL
jgi:hypothetical protein